jgi:hypothetical protein
MGKTQLELCFVFHGLSSSFSHSSIFINLPYKRMVMGKTQLELCFVFHGLQLICQAMVIVSLSPFSAYCSFTASFAFI